MSQVNYVLFFLDRYDAHMHPDGRGALYTFSRGQFWGALRGMLQHDWEFSLIVN